MSIFEQGTRTKLRFSTPNGMLGIEDLWDLKLTSQRANVANLDDIARYLDAELKSSASVSFVKEGSETNAATKLAFDIVLHIINVKLAEQKAASLAADNREKKQRIMAIIEQKQSEALSASSIEDLQQMLNTL